MQPVVDVLDGDERRRIGLMECGEQGEQSHGAV